MSPLMDGQAGFGEFEFDLPAALQERLVAHLSELGMAPLTDEMAKNVPDEQGVYQLFVGDTLVYIGKTDGDAGLSRRLRRHAQKIQHRVGLDPGLVSFKALRVFVFTAIDLESYLIKHYGGVKNVPWSGSGFGSNDPGRQRDTTSVKSDQFDAMYPIDIDRLIDPAAGVRTVARAMQWLMGSVPYTIRVERPTGTKRGFHVDFDAALSNAPVGAASVREWLTCIVRSLPAGWQVTALPGYVIAYRENRQYPHATIFQSQ